MPDWLKSVDSNSIGPVSQPFLHIALLLGLAAIAGGVISRIYRWTQVNRRSDEGLGIPTTLVLLTILVAMTTMVIDDSVARAFSLVGALSIVRFRTVVDDTRDTAFVIFAVVIGMAVGSAHFMTALIGIPVVAVVARLMRSGASQIDKRIENLKIDVRLALGKDPSILDTVLARHLDSFRMTTIATAKQGTSIDVHFVAAQKEGTKTYDLAAELNRVEGVQSIAISEASRA